MDIIGRFRIESKIGQGSMGVVYRASDPTLDRPVAIKTYHLPDGFPERRREEFRARFMREARAAGALDHPGIVTVYDAGEDRETGVPFIAMEYVPGISLQDRLARDGALQPDEAVTLVATLAEALQVAHERGIVHRDVKPANVLIRDPDGAVKIADFGVARVGSSTLTSSGVPIGSPAYMSPEQVRGEPVDGRSDLFSLAVMAYEALCGRRPFEGDDTAEVLYGIVHRHPIAPGRVRDGLPATLDSFFEVALAKDPAARFPDGRSFARAFERAITAPRTAAGDETIRPGAIPSTRARWWPVSRPRRIAALVIVLTVSTLGGWVVHGNLTTYMKIDARSAVTAGELTVFVDDHPVFRRDLMAPADRQGFLKRVAGKNLESFETLVRVPPGRREVSARIADPDGGEGTRTAIVVTFERGETRTVELSAGRMFGAALALKAR